MYYPKYSCKLKYSKRFWYNTKIDLKKIINLLLIIFNNVFFKHCLIIKIKLFWLIIINVNAK